MDLKQIALGFKDVGYSSQRIFRQVMQAFSRPGNIYSVADDISQTPYAPGAATQILLAMLDSETSLFISKSTSKHRLDDYLRFHTACNMAQQPNDAQFSYFSISDNLPHLSEMAIGSDEYPDQGATILIEVSEFKVDAVTGVSISGPGLKEPKRIDIVGIANSFWQERQTLQKEFPKGIDLLFCCGLEFIGLPRSTQVEI